MSVLLKLYKFQVGLSQVTFWVFLQKAQTENAFAQKHFRSVSKDSKNFPSTDVKRSRGILFYSLILTHTPQLQKGRFTHWVSSY